MTYVIPVVLLTSTSDWTVECHRTPADHPPWSLSLVKRTGTGWTDRTGSLDTDREPWTEPEMHDRLSDQDETPSVGNDPRRQIRFYVLRKEVRPECKFHTVNLEPPETSIEVRPYTDLGKGRPVKTSTCTRLFRVRTFGDFPIPRVLSPDYLYQRVDRTTTGRSLRSRTWRTTRDVLTRSTPPGPQGLRQPPVRTQGSVRTRSLQGPLETYSVLTLLSVCPDFLVNGESPLDPGVHPGPTEESVGETTRGPGGREGKRPQRPEPKCRPKRRRGSRETLPSVSEEDQRELRLSED